MYPAPMHHVPVSGAAYGPYIQPMGTVQPPSLPPGGPFVPSIPLPNTFASSIFDCCDDMDSALLGGVCWCTLAAHNNAILHGRPDMETKDWAICAAACCFFIMTGYSFASMGLAFSNKKSAVRVYGLQGEEPLVDCLLSIFCGPCVDCQVAREIKIRNGLLPPSRAYTPMRIV